MRGMLFGIERISVVAFLLCMCTISLTYIDSAIYKLFKYGCLCIVLVYCLKYICVILSKEWKIILSLTLMCVGMFVSTYLNFSFSYQLRDVLYYIVLLITIFLFMIVAGWRNKLHLVLKVFILYLLIVVLFNDALMIMFPEEFYGVNDIEIGNMLLGNKFNVTYTHFLLLVISIFIDKKYCNKKKIIVLTIIYGLVCLYVDCVTLLLGGIIYVVLYFIPQKIKKFLMQPYIFIVMLFLSAYMIVGFGKILEFSPIQYLVGGVLKRDLTLTGRLEVYQYIPTIIQNRPWFGYGYENTIFLTITKWYANAQNGFWEFVINSGLISGFFLIAFLYMIVKKCNRINAKIGYDHDIWVFYAALIVYLVIATVEICFSTQFFLLWGLLVGVCTSKTNYSNEKNSRR